MVSFGIWDFFGIWTLEFEIFLSSSCRLSLRRTRSLISAAPGQQEHQTYPSTNRAVSHIKRRKTDLSPAPLLHVEIKKVDHAADANAVDQVSDDASANQAESELAEGGASIEVMTREEKHDQRDQRYDRQFGVAPLEKAPRGSRVLPMNQLEKSGNDDLLMNGRG
jgi:hypothetical protein